jgi:myo-inositol-1-phosphate synthase
MISFLLLKNNIYIITAFAYTPRIIPGTNKKNNNMSREKIKVAIVGVGNCASSLVQGVSYYTLNKEKESGLMMPDIGGYSASDIDFVVAFDVDERKVGKLIKDAIFEKPNCTMVLQKDIVNCSGTVLRAPSLDGISNHMSLYPIDDTFKEDCLYPIMTEEQIIDVLVDKKVDIIINYLPVGSQLATEFWANICLKTGISFMNCIPVFIASDPTWASRFEKANALIIGDDMKSEFGASIVSQMLQELAFSRGHKVKCHIQRNVGGNTDFLNMENKDRLSSKKISKENVIRSQNDIRHISTEGSFLHAGPSEYIKFYGDNKIANFHIELEGFMGSPVILDAQLSVQDSPNSAGVVIDAIRYLQVAKELGLSGALHGASAWTQKTPPIQLTAEQAQLECQKLADRIIPTLS